MKSKDKHIKQIVSEINKTVASQNEKNPKLISIQKNIRERNVQFEQMKNSNEKNDSSTLGENQQPPNLNLCFCSSTQWKCRKCFTNTCDFCGINPELNSKRICRKCSL